MSGLKTLHEINQDKYRVSIEVLKLSQNYKDVTVPSVEKLKRSLMEDDQLLPILTDAREDHEGEIIGGYHQYFALKELIDEGKWQEKGYGDKVWVEPRQPKDDKHRKVLSLKHNAQYDIATSERLAEYTMDLVDSEYMLSDIPVITDYEMLTALDVIDQYTKDNQPDVVEDDAPEVDEVNEPISQLGEVYTLGRHRLMCGDSTKIEDVEKLMNGQKADMVFTDPPYGVNYQSNMRVESEKFDVLKNDDEVLTDWIIPATMFSTGWFLFCTSWKVLPKWFDVGKNIDITNGLTNMIIWDKGGGGIGDLEHSLLTDYEMILAYNRGNKIVGKRLGSVWSIGKDGSMNYAHPTQKPVELPALAIQTLSKGSVLDLFGGSGSTLIACEQLDRTCYMMEIDPKYCDVIRKRYAKFVGSENEWQSVTSVVEDVYTE